MFEERKRRPRIRVLGPRDTGYGPHAFDGCDEMSKRWLDRSLLGTFVFATHEPAHDTFQLPPEPLTTQPAAGAEQDGLCCSLVRSATSQEYSWDISRQRVEDLPLAEALRKLCGE